MLRANFKSQALRRWVGAAFLFAVAFLQLEMRPNHPSGKVKREYCSTDVFIFVTSFKACSGSHSSEAKRLFSIVKGRQSPQLRENCPGSFWITLIFFDSGGRKPFSLSFTFRIRFDIFGVLLFACVTAPFKQRSREGKSMSMAISRLDMFAQFQNPNVSKVAEVFSDFA